MFDWIKKIFGKKRLPHKGELWVLKSSVRDESPFPVTGKLTVIAEILDCRKGWVRYSYIDEAGIAFPDSDERNIISRFTSIYEPVVPLWENEEVIRRILDVRQS